MLSQRLTALSILLGSAALACWAATYTGPMPPKSDMLYLVHADNLVPTEATDAKESGKGGTTYVIDGAASSARTPIAEPILIMKSDKITPDSLELYKLDVKGNRREISLGSRKAKPLHVAVTRLGQGLFRVEADEFLENGEYVLTPMGSDRVFCFEVY